MGSRLEIEVNEAAPAEWDESLRSVGGVVFHCTDWAGYKVTEGGGEPLYFVWREPGSGEVVGRALAMRRPPRSSAVARLGFKLAFDSPPASTTEGLDFVAPLEEWAKGQAGLLEVELGSYDARGVWRGDGPPNPRGRLEFELPAGDVESLWSEMRQLARRKVKRAQKDGFDCNRAEDSSELRAFADVYAVTVTRLHDNKGVEVGSGIEPAGFATALTELGRRGVGAVYTANLGAQVEAGVVFATFADRAYMIHSGASDAGRNAGAPFLVLYEALRDLRQRGFAAINLGGAAADATDPSSSEHGLHQFKTRFGAAVVPCTSGSLQPRPGRARLVGVARRLARR